LEQVEAQRQLRASLAALPEAQRVVVLLRAAHGLSLAEIAETLCLPEGTVKSRLHYAVRRLRAQGEPARRADQEGHGS
jgi:RNA polymerase sigma-70 factor (ECF subfamily)